MGKTLSNLFTLFLALVGCVVACLLTWEHFHPQADIGCSTLKGNCQATIDSAYGHIGPLPTSVLGLAMYLTIGAICVQRLRLQREQRAQRERERDSSISVSTPSDSSTDAARAELEADTGATPSPSPAPFGGSSGSGSGQQAAWQLAANLKRLDGVVWGIALLAFFISWWLQFVALTIIHSFCPWCFSSAIFFVTLILVFSSYGYLLYGRKLTGEHKLLAGVLAFVLVMVGFIGMGPFLGWIQANLIPAPKTGEIVKPDQRKLVLARKDMQTKGDPNAQVLIVEFADYQCSHCKEASEALDHYMKANPKKIRLAFRNYPLPSHRWAKAAAIAAEAAGQQGKFWQMHDFIFDHQLEMESPGFTVNVFNRWAEALNLDMDKFKKDEQDPNVIVRVELDMANGDRGLGIHLTPSFYVVSKKNMFAYTGTTELQKAMGNPLAPMWQ